jgi:preprotein translocase subunit SecE
VSWVDALLAALLLAVAAALVVYRERVRSGAAAFTQFLREVKAEVEKITWPDKPQLRNATLVILGFVALVALVIGIMDVVLQWLVVGLPARLS